MTRAVSKFRPCIDLHDGKVKQIVGGSIDRPDFKENFVSEHAPGHYATMFRNDDLHGGHVIRLGDGNDAAAEEALSVWPEGLQIGGGITLDNGQQWLEKGASHIIVTSWLFNDGELDWERVRLLAKEIGSCRIVIDLSCRRADDAWKVTTQRWKNITNTQLSFELLERLSPYCDEFLIHAADVEGKVAGIDEDLVRMLSEFDSRRITYAGGIATLADIELINRASGGGLDFTVGSGLDIFGGTALKYRELLDWNQRTGTPV